MNAMSGFQFREQLRGDVKALLDKAYDRGFAAGERVGRRDQHARHLAQLGVAYIVGVVSTGIVVLVALSWWPA